MSGGRSLLRRAADQRYRWTEALRRGSVVHGTARFAWSEGTRSTDTVAYRLRHGGLKAHVRHGTGDAAGLREIFLNGNYDPSPAVRAVLDARAGTSGLRIADLGGNIGLFALHAFARFPIAQVTSFEADPDNARILDLTRRANGLEDRWELVEACAAAVDGEARFVAGLHMESRVARDGEPGTTTVEQVDVFAHLDRVDWLKMDVEGGEWEILADPRFASLEIPVLALEYHPFGCPGPVPRDEITRLLEDAGYRIEPYEERGDGLGELWALHAGATAE